MSKKKSVINDEWQELRKSLLTEEELAETDIKIALLGEIIEARQKSGITQKQLEELSGVRQPVIARLERGTTDPQLSTMIRILACLEKTLTITNLKQNCK